MTSTTITVRHNFLPLPAMTDAQQIDHLMGAHGFDEDYGYSGPGPIFPDLTTREEVRAMFAHWTRAERESYHADEHSDYPYGGGTCHHEHTKPMPVNFV